MKRIFVEKKPQFQVKVLAFTNDIQNNLYITIPNVRIINVYDVENLQDDQLDKVVSHVFSEPLTDETFESIDLTNHKAFAVELLPGQFDIRAESAMQCIKLLFPNANPQVATSILYVFENSLSTDDLLTVKNYVINPIESQEKDLHLSAKATFNQVSEVSVLHDFTNFDTSQLEAFWQSAKLAMSLDDLQFIQAYFKQTEKRNPTETEIKILDTYWSDHCRHTTFETNITEVSFEEGELANEIKRVLDLVMSTQAKVAPKKHFTLMSLATMRFKEMLQAKLLPMVEISDENNACSIFIDVDVDNKSNKYLIQFKNETHNHPTEIEPFGGASTCLGGAIRDPLSGRSYVYQAMRVSGSGNPLEAIKETLAHKLPQRHISKTAALGFASYGNEIGLATTMVQEIIHPGYKAKHLETGFVVGASLASNVRREKPSTGDLIILLGGATGRDGIGGATGSSKAHNESSTKVLLAEVQKGNPTEERKLQRLFANPNFSKLIKKANDFGAGGVAVAVGEIADGIDINLDKVPLKYAGLNGTEIAISESQERMAIVIEQQNLELVQKLAQDENVTATHIASVTDSNRLVMHWKQQTIVDIARDFIATNGARKATKAHINKQLQFHRQVAGHSLEEKFINNLRDLNVASQQKLTQIFDNTIGTTTILMPYGGKKQITKVHASVQKVPLFNGGFTNTVTYASFDFNPDLTTSSPFLGGMYAVIGSIAKNLAHGGNLATMHFSFQEYFEKLGTDESKWGKPLATLLGAYESLSAFNKAAIGGKDSMSGSFGELNVPPTLISFAISYGDARNAIAGDFKKPGNYIYLLKHQKLSNMMPNFECLKNNFKLIENKILSKEIISAWPIVNGGIAEALAVMSFGNNLGFDVQTSEDIFDINIGSFIIETPSKINYSNCILLGKVTKDSFVINSIKIDPKTALKAYQEPYEQIFENQLFADTKADKVVTPKALLRSYVPTNLKSTPLVVIAIFPGTNCEFDIERKFLREGAKTHQVVFKNQTTKDIEKSIFELEQAIKKADIFVIPGGFSGSDEPDGSGKFIANVLQNTKIMHVLNDLRERKGLILGICNGFQALVKCGLLPDASAIHDATLFRNASNSHISRYVKTKVTSVSSPWLAGLEYGATHLIPISHGEGRFIASEVTIKQLSSNGQIAFQYVDDNDDPTMNAIFNPNGSLHAIEGVVSRDGLILGKMGHSERFEDNISQNIPGNKNQNIFKSAIQYFKGEFK